jgi:hypothetical protein
MPAAAFLEKMLDHRAVSLRPMHLLFLLVCSALFCPAASAGDGGEEPWFRVDFKGAVLSEATRKAARDGWGEPEFAVRLYAEGVKRAQISLYGKGYIAVRPGTQVGVRLVEEDPFQDDMLTDIVYTPWPPKEGIRFTGGSLIVLDATPFQPDGHSGADARLAGAHPLRPRMSVKGSISFVHGDRTDWFRIAPQREGILYLILHRTGGSGDFRMEIRDASGVPVAKPMPYKGPHRKLWVIRAVVRAGQYPLVLRSGVGCSSTRYLIYGDLGEPSGPCPGDTLLFLLRLAGREDVFFKQSFRKELTHVAEELGIRGHPGVLDQALKESVEVRKVVVGIMGRMNTPEARKKLEALARSDPSVAVRDAAREAMKPQGEGQ